MGTSSPLTMLGDQGPAGTISIPGIAFGRPGSPGFPPVPGASLAKIAASTVLVPSLRGFKIGEYESPLPFDRAYVAFNFFNRVNEAVDLRFGGDIHNVNVYRETLGVEKTFLTDDFSIGLRVPLNTLSAESSFPVLGGTSTDVGDLTTIFKYAFWHNRETGSALSAGLCVTAPTGPDAFAGQATFTTFHNTILQPFVGYRWVSGDFYLQGFLAVDIPTDSNDVTILYNDLGIGYYLFRAGAESNRLITAVVPTVEVHVNDPLNHRGVLNVNDVAGLQDVVDLTTGCHLELGKRAQVAVGVVTPVTGPKPFDIEVLAQFSFRFGGGRDRHQQTMNSCCSQ
jgi:hypothetical protein